ncbi:MAG: APC family permease [Candidatus Obscuribacterales bacterium]
MSVAIKERPTAVVDTASAELISASTKIGAGMQIGIGAFGAWALGVSSNIGSMAFLFHGCMIASGGPLASVLAWTIAACMALPLALVLAELSSMFPSAGGPYVYKYFALKRLVPGMGECLGFLTGWIFFVYLISGYACMSNGLVNMLSNAIWGAPQASPLWFGPAVITGLFGSLTWLNLMQVKEASRLNNVFTLLKVAAVLAFISLALNCKTMSFTNILSASNLSGGNNLFANIAVVLPLAMAGFSGIEMVGCTASETKDARKSVPTAILRTVLTIAIIYVSMCVATSIITPYALSVDKTMAVVPGTQVIATAPALAEYLGGKIWGLALTIGVIMSIFSCGFCGLLAAARTSMSMAQTGLFPAQFAKLDSQTRVPKYALIFQLVLLCATGCGAFLLARLGVVPDAYSFLGGACGFIYGVLAMLYGVCLIGLRYTDPTMPRPFRLGRSGNAVAWLFALGSFAVFGFVAFGCSQLSHEIAGSVLLLSGLPIYGYYRWRARSVG